MSALPKPPKEVPREMRLDVLAPAFRAALEAVVMELRLKGFKTVYVAETLRSHGRQEFLYGFGRLYDDGRGRVTFSKDADETWHGFGLAADLWDAANPKAPWALPPALQKALWEACKRNGLDWGGDWNMNGKRDQSFYDIPHVQWGRCRRSPSPRAARLKEEGGFYRVWEEVGALLMPKAA